MTNKSRGITVFLIVLALIAGIAMTKVGSKYRTQENVNLIFSNVTSNSAKEAGVYFKDLVEKVTHRGDNEGLPTHAELTAFMENKYNE